MWLGMKVSSNATGKNSLVVEIKDACTNDRYHSPEQALKSLFGYDSFRVGQKSVIDNILAGRDAFAVMPTGAGKSVCYQIPAVLLPGITLVISPLISLMQDQVQALNEAGVPAAFINSALSEKDYNETIRNAREGLYKIIYIAPEKAAKTKKKAKSVETLTASGYKLFERLKKLRLEIAREENMPPYIIFSDKTLIDMAAKIPASKTEMLDVSGVGEYKLAKYGERFLRVIEENRSE